MTASTISLGEELKRGRIPFYRGGLSMWAWVAQRITGVLIYVFLLIHVADNLMLRVSPDAYNEVIHTYKTLVVGLGEIGLVAAILGHALNGLRIVFIDLWGKGVGKTNQMLWGAVIIWALLMIPFTVNHLSHYFK
ncbi:succinate dehydrogenase, cytochrome b556 subunit [Nocardia sp. NPDC051030]|uniref:succinate dehydrogenase, cytochrome b556 subunit n=1 Tax=Nocardia sp. NPDC051030 TaxID=3155162 RepID=UPI00343FFDF9